MSIGALRWVGWNLFLAAIPVILGYATAWGLSKQGKGHRLPLLICIPLAIAWIFFLPNSCYLLTEWRHLLFDERWKDLLESGHTDRGAMLSTAKWALLFLAYSGTGVLMFVLAVRPMERWLRSTGQKSFLFAPLFFFVVSLGVYIGLIVRLNTWDVIHRPVRVWDAVGDGLFVPGHVVPIAAFALILWGTYEAVDLWIDGVAARLAKKV